MIKKVLLFGFSVTTFLAFGQITETLTVLQYNLMNYGNTTSFCDPTNNNLTAKDANLKLITKDVLPDIFTCNEIGAIEINTDRILGNVLNTDGVTHYARAVYSSNSNLVSMLYYNTDKLGLKSQEKVDKNLNGTKIIREIGIYNLYFKDPNFPTTTDTVFITCIVAHLKASSSQSDLDQRNLATASLMSYLSNNLPIGNYLFMGDLNTKNDAELGFQNVVNYSNTAYKFNDPIASLGFWNNNSTFKMIHTQSTHSNDGSTCFSQGGMDDRFDFILASNNIMTGGKKVQYQSGSYKSYGQDGNHFNGAINSGTNTAVSQTLADALFNMSDHLPVIMKLDINTSGFGTSVIENKLIDNGIKLTNPINNHLSINWFNPLNQTQLNVAVYDLTGKLIDTFQVHSGYNGRDVSTYKNGLYLIHFSNKEGLVGITKLVKIN